MRTHGWRGDPPATDEEARRRIIEATARCVDRYGPRKTSLSDVADELGVGRPTIYRYYRGLGDLLRATSLAAAGEFAGRLKAHVAGIEDPAELVVELLAYVIERLPGEPRVGLLIATGDAAGLGIELMSPAALGLTRDLLRDVGVDWQALGYSGDDLDGLAEFLLRMLRSYLPGPEPMPGADSVGRERNEEPVPDPRPFLRRWVAPALTAPARMGV